MKKCIYIKPEVKYPGHLIAKYAIKSDPDEIKAIIDLPCPSTVMILGDCWVWSIISSSLFQIYVEFYNLSTTC